MPDESPAVMLMLSRTSKAYYSRNLTIGRTLDTSDDMARVMLVTHYAGTKMVRVYNAGAEETLSVIEHEGGLPHYRRYGVPMTPRKT